MEFNWNTVMKQRTNIYALATIWIIFFHIYQVLWTPECFGVSHILNSGSSAVDVFLFLSAIGLSRSMEKNNVKDFYKNRLRRILIPWFLVAVPYFILFEIIDGWKLSDFFNCIFDVSTLSFWFAKDFANIATWYVSFLVVMYIMYPLLFKLYKRNKFYIVGLMSLFIIFQIIFMRTGVDFFVNYEISFSRIPIFLLGILFSDYIKTAPSIKKWQLLASVGIYAVCFCLLHIDAVPKTGVLPFKRYLFGIMAVQFVVIGAFVLNKITSKKILHLLNITGVNSFEIYLIHSVIIRGIQILDFKYPQFWAVYYIFILAVSIILAMACRKVSDKILGNFSEKQISKS